MNQQRRRFRWGFVVLGVLLVALLVWLFIAGHPAKKPAGPPATSVSVSKVTMQDFPLTLTALGAAQAWQSVLINPQVSGRLTYVATEGDYVPAGALLVEIDCSPYQAALTQVRGALRRDQAILQGAQTDLTRYTTLMAQNSIARQTQEDQAATVKQDQGTVVADQGAVATAQVNVGWCRIPSPVAGRVGVRLVDPGNIVSAGQTTGIISVNQVEPIAVTFTVPQGSFQQLVAASNGFTLPLAVEAFSQETGADLGAGVLQVADNHVDQTTGTVELKARFPNPGRVLWPGQFINVRLTLQTVPRAVVAPAAAINDGPKGSYAYVVAADKTVSVRPVTVLTTQDNVAVIKSGLTPGETVVTDGQMSLKPGVTVSFGGGGGNGGNGGGKASNP